MEKKMKAKKGVAGKPLARAFQKTAGVRNVGAAKAFAKAVNKKSASVVIVSAKKVASSKKQSDILSSIHESIVGLHKAGAVSIETMRKFDDLCLEPVVSLKPSEIAALRKEQMVSQPVFAKYLNVSKSSVAQWESGERSPDGPALKLLNLVRRRGLEILA